MNRLLPTRITSPFEVDGDSIADVVPRVIDRRQRLAKLLEGVEDGVGDRVGKLRLGGRCIAENLVRVVVAAGNDPADFGRSRVSVPVLSKRTVSTSFMSSSARPSLTRMPLCAHSASDESIASGAAMRMPVPKSLLRIATAPPGPIVAMPRLASASVGMTALSARRSPLCCEVSL